VPRLSRVLAALSVGALVLIDSQSASAAPPCVVTYQPNVWASGFTANVAVTNNGAPVTAWTVTWTYTGGQQITSGWNHDCLPTDALLRGHGAGRRVHSGPLHFGGPGGSDDGSDDRCIPADATPAKGVS
jgi:hypothetical protein